MIGVLIIGILILVTQDPNMLPEIHVKCLKDTLFEISTPVNHFFIKHDQAKSVIIAILAAFTDAIILF